MDKLYTVGEVLQAMEAAFDKGWDRGSTGSFDPLTIADALAIIDGLSEPDL